MSSVEVLSLIVTIVCLLSFCLVFTFLFRHYYLNSIDEVRCGRADFDVIEFDKERVEKNSLKREKSKKIIGKTIGYTFLVAIVIFFGFSVYSRFFNNNLIFGDSGFIVISSGSMSQRNEANDYLDEYQLYNQFDTYDIIGVTKYQSIEDVEQFDVVAFYGQDDIIYVHRIIEVRDNNTFVTRGDSNAISDTNRLYNGYLTYDKIIGYYNGSRAPLIGVFIVFLQSNSGIITILSVVYCLLMFDHYKTKYDEAIEDRIQFLNRLLKIDYSKITNLENDLKILQKETIVFKGETFAISDGTPEVIEENNKKSQSQNDKKPTKVQYFIENIKNKFRKGKGE